MNNFNNTTYIPDVLDCLSSLSNDEVFTSPKMVNMMLDNLPQELFRSKETKFLDPAAKTGVFIREIVKRLDAGLKDKIPDRQERINHILHKQVFCIAISDMTAFLSRRAIYCSKYAMAFDTSKENLTWKDSKNKIHITKSYSISTFTDEDIGFFCEKPINGNVRFNSNVKHDYSHGDVCSYCGANKNVLNEDEYAYEFIHMTKTTIERLRDMHIDVIVTNPPYQFTDASLGASATPLYHKFIIQAKKVEPRYILMIIPSRWMAGGKGLDDFRKEMIEDKHIVKLHDFIDSSVCFSEVDIKGGVCYFLWDRDNESPCDIYTYKNGDIIHSIRYLKDEDADVFIRYPELVNIKNKVWENKFQTSFKNLVSNRKPYGFSADFFQPMIEKEIDGKREKIISSTKEKYDLESALNSPCEDGYEILGLEGNKRVWKYLKKDYNFIKSYGLGKYKIFISKAYGNGAIGEKPSQPVLAYPNQVCTETFLEIGYWDNIIEAQNALKYVQTKFFKCLVSICKQTQNSSAKSYRYVPAQDFSLASDIDWSQELPEIDKQLYKKYKLTEKDINFIEDNIKDY